MSFAEGTRVVFGYVEEDVQGTTPTTPTLKTLRATVRNVNLEKDILRSAEVRASRQVSDSRHGMNRVAGQVGFQLSIGDYDDMLRFALGGVAWMGKTTGKTTLGKTTTTITRASGSFLTDGFRPGDYVILGGFATNNATAYLVTAVVALTLTLNATMTADGAGDADEIVHLAGAHSSAVTTGVTSLGVSGGNFTRAAGSFLTDGFKVGDTVNSTVFTSGAYNGTFVITALSATTMTPYPVITGTEAAGANEVIAVRANTGKRLDVGTTLKTFTLERQFQDILKYVPFRGVVNDLALTFSPDAMVNGTLAMLGMSAGAMADTSVSASPPVAIADARPFANFDGYFYEGGTLMAVATSLDLALNNQRRLTGVLGSKYSPAVFNGTAQLNGNIGIILQSGDTFYNKFANETETSFWTRLNDPDGLNFMCFNFHRAKINAVPINPGQEGPVIMAGVYEALEHTTFGTALSIQKTNAAA